MIQAIITFITCLPQIISLVTSFIAWVNKVSGNDPAGYLLKLNKVFDDLNNAKTQEEHFQSAQDLASLISGSK